jgi:hypothetical protein
VRACAGKELRGYGEVEGEGVLLPSTQDAWTREVGIVDWLLERQEAMAGFGPA